MTSNITTSTGELRHLSPTELVIDTNIRTEAEATLTPEFIDSIRSGVRQPILAIAVDGEIRVRDGQRRTLAAREAELTTIPVYVLPVATDADDKAATVDRILEQLASFEREDLRASDRVAAIEQLALSGMSATKIAKATRTKKKDVDHTLAVAKSSTALDLLDQGAGLTLEQSATLAAYDHDLEAQQWLLHAAQTGRFEYQAKVLADADERPALLAQVATYAAEGIAAVTRQPLYNEANRLDRLLTPAGKAATIEDVPVDHRVAYVWADETESWTDAEGNAVAEDSIDWSLEDDVFDDNAEPSEGLRDPRTLTRNVTREVETTWYVLRNDDLGFTERPYSYNTQSSATATADLSDNEKEAQRQERRRVRVLNAASLTAREVRIEKLTAWLARKTLPKGSAPKVAKFIATSMRAHHDMFGANSMQGNATEIAATILGGDPAELIEQATTADRAQIIGLGIALASREAHMWKDAWRNVGDSHYLGSDQVAARGDYLRFLVEVTGYTLADVEKVIAGDTDASDVPLD